MYLSSSKKGLVEIGFLASLIFYIVMTFPLLDSLPVTMDEVLFAEPARNFIEEGHFGTTALKGLFGFGEKTYWQHPLYIALMYVPIKLFGYNCWSLKVLSTTAGLLSIFFAYRIGRKFGVPHLFPMLLVFNVLFIFMARMGRMEMLTLCISLASFYYAWEKRAVSAGLLGGLAVLNHPIGVFTVVNSVIILKHLKGLDRRFAIGLLIPLLTATVFVVGDFGEFIRQYYTVQHYLYDNSGWLGGPFIQLRNFVNLLLAARKWLFWLLPLFLLFFIGLTKPQDSRSRIIILVQLVSFLGLLVLIPNKYVNYYVALVLPYTALYAAYSIRNTRTITVTVLLSILVLTNVIGLAKNYHSCIGSYSSQSKYELQELVKPNSVVLAQPNVSVYLDSCEVVGFHNVRMIMDLEGKSIEQALEEIQPDYLIFDTDIAAFVEWPLFTADQNEMGEFVKEHTEFCGRREIHNKQYFVFKFVKLP